MELRNRATRRWRAAALLLAGALVGVALTATPASSHVGGTVNHLWSHLRPKTDARYHRKAVADARFLPGGNLTRGRTIRGTYAVEDVAGGIAHAVGSISFGWRLASAPTPHVVLAGDTPPRQCPGSLASPAASPGHLCIYEGQSLNRAFLTAENPVTGAEPAASRFGVMLNLISGGAGSFHSSGTWAVRSP
jgi:hypothetical protein